MDIKNGRRKSFDVEYVLVTDENMAEVAEWSGGVVGGEEDNQFVRISDKNILHQRQTRAYAKDYMVHHLGLNTFRVFTKQAFKRNFEDTSPETLKEHMDREAQEHDRSAVTGQFVSHETVEANPDTTVHEMTE